MGLEKIAERKKELGLTTEELSIKSGVPVGTLNKILNGTTTDPKLETLKSLSKVLGLKLDYFVDDVFVEDHSKTEYYLDEETAKKAQEIFSNKDLSLLFDAARDASPEDIQTVHTMLLALKRKEK